MKPNVAMLCAASSLLLHASARAEPTGSVLAEPLPEEATPVPEDAPLAEVTVRVISAAGKLRQSAEAVQVIDLQDAQRRTEDLGQTLARCAGVSVQRAGGLGSDTRFGLNGLEGDQVRFSVDGVPLAFAGFSFGFAQ